MTDSGRILAGIGFGVAAGALWGLVFIAPELVRTFTPLQLSAGRYLAYGLFATVLVAPRWRELTVRLGRSEWRALAWLSLLGNILYYVLLASAVQLGGVAITSLVIGFLPIAITIIGSRDRNAVPLHKLIPSLLMSAAAILCIGWEALGATATGAQTARIAGFLCAVGALLSWTAYAVGNSRCLARLDHLSAHDWNLLVGVMTGAQALLLVPPALLIGTTSHSLPEWLQFAAVAAGIAIFASIIGNALWNRMSRLLPLTLAGQMILFETLFALLYGFLWEQRLPTVGEAIAIVLVAASVLSCVSAHRLRPPHPPSDQRECAGGPPRSGQA
ncbi:DMT family transporter [Sphingomonas sp. KC8]|uniref:DMT family transporter n=1 Tax=Sphingomonas sp. KC8 TaxID=1030157 RepID=UPI000248978F|nr:DMT family transporter [Sphingomonas sp. KC8]ARS26585.1 multidrug DMT transporter permease [Sphingomonas sp. KC8]